MTIEPSTFWVLFCLARVLLKFAVKLGSHALNARWIAFFGVSTEYIWIWMIRIIRHHQVQIVLQRQLELAVMHEVLQPHGILQLDLVWVLLNVSRK
jgi:hypothetical protein